MRKIKVMTLMMMVMWKVWFPLDNKPVCGIVIGATFSMNVHRLIVRLDNGLIRDVKIHDVTDSKAVEVEP